jgi:hypothetical protein
MRMPEACAPGNATMSEQLGREREVCAKIADELREIVEREIKDRGSWPIDGYEDGFCDALPPPGSATMSEQLGREREACAKMADELREIWERDKKDRDSWAINRYEEGFCDALLSLAAKIRARGRGVVGANVGKHGAT